MRAPVLELLWWEGCPSTERALTELCAALAALGLHGAEVVTRAIHTDDEAQAARFPTCNHCPYALAWHERIADAARDYADRGVRFLAINANDAERYPKDSPEAMRSRVEAEDWPMPYLHDATQATWPSLGSSGSPAACQSVIPPAMLWASNPAWANASVAIAERPPLRQ
jgi:hypothetical protein